MMMRLSCIGYLYYNPEWGRWISPADLNPQIINGLNLYAYAGNNPICRIGSSVSLNQVQGFNGISSVSANSISTYYSSSGNIINTSSPSRYVSMMHKTSSFMGDSYFGNAMGFVIGNFSKTTSIQANSVNGFYYYSNLGNGGNSFGVGFNANGYVGYSMYVTDRVGIGSSGSIGNLNLGAEVSLLDGISVSVGVSSGNVSTDYSVSVGWGTLAGAYVVATGMAALPIPGARVAAGLTALVIVLIDVFN